MRSSQPPEVLHPSLCTAVHSEFGFTRQMWLPSALCMKNALRAGLAGAGGLLSPPGSREFTGARTHCVELRITTEGGELAGASDAARSSSAATVPEASPFAAPVAAALCGEVGQGTR